MFTGIIQAIGQIKSMTAVKGDFRVDITVNNLDMSDVQLGDSIAVNGVCLTVVAFDTATFSADVSNETLSLSAMRQLKTGSKVNLEKALSLKDRLGGHLVSGHVDGQGEIIAITQDGRSSRFHIRPEESLVRYIAKKGSITVDGVSLTVNEVSNEHFELNIVPHTLEETIMSEYKVSYKVNLEVDVIARYVERLLQHQDPKQPESKLSMQLLAEHGFLK